MIMISGWDIFQSISTIYSWFIYMDIQYYNSTYYMNIITYLLNPYVDTFTRNHKYSCNHKGHNMKKTFENELLKALSCKLSHLYL